MRQLGDATQFEKKIISLLDEAKSDKEIKRIVVISECSSGEVISCSEYVFVDYGNECISKKSIGLSGELKSNSCDIKNINGLLDFLKAKKVIPNKKYLKVFDADKTFSVYEIKGDEIYANMFFYTWEYMELLDKVINPK